MTEAHQLETCPQEKRLEKIELVTDGTVRQLAGLNETLIRVETLLSGKISVYDKHVDSGEKWRSDMFKLLITACLAGVMSTVGFGIWVGRISQEVGTNSQRWDRFLAIEAKILMDNQALQMNK